MTGEHCHVDKSGELGGTAVFLDRAGAEDRDGDEEGFLGGLTCDDLKGGGYVRGGYVRGGERG